MVLKYIVFGFAWVCVVGAFAMLLHIKEGASKLDSAMGFVCAASLFFLYPKIVHSVYLAEYQIGTYEIADHREHDIKYTKILGAGFQDGKPVVYLHKTNPIIKVDDPYYIDPDKRYEDLTDFPKSQYNAMYWEFLSADEQIEYLDKQEAHFDKCHPLPPTDVDNEDMNISALVGLLFLGIIGTVVKFIHIVTLPFCRISYCFIAPLIWFVYLTY